MFKKLNTILLTYFIVCFCYAQNNLNIRTYKGAKYENVGISEHVYLYKKMGTNKYYFAAPLGNKLKRLTYHNIIYKNGSTDRVRENCRELRRRNIKLYEKHKDGEYFVFKVFNSYIQ